MANSGDLDDWIYAEALLLSTLDADLAQKHGKAQIARGLSSNRLIAVVGSGLSRAYGHPSWTDLLRDTTFHVMEALFVVVGQNAALPADNLLGKELNRFFDNAASKEEPWFLPLAANWRAFSRYGLAQLPLKVANTLTAFEVCENLLAAIRVYERLRKDYDFSRRDIEREAFHELRERLKWLLQDNRGRLSNALRRLTGREDLTDPDRTDLGRIRARLAPGKGHDDYATALAWAFYGREEKLAGEPASGASVPRPLCRELLAGLDRGEPLTPAFRAMFGKDSATPDRADQQCEDDPNHFGLVDAMAELADQATLVAWLGRMETWLKDRDNVSRLVNQARQARTRLAATQDPYALLIDELEIRRVLTTNYDDELDRLLESRGFSEKRRDDMSPLLAEDPVGPGKPPVTRSMYVDAVEQRAEVIDCAPGSAAYMFEYGANRKDNRIQALHIHGRARKAESKLVLSERDYRERYARDEDPVAKSDDAMRQIFNGNPLLFLGLGMSEPDILRPLRAYSGDIARITERPAVALLPHGKGVEDERQLMRALSEYGVYTVLYGDAEVACDDAKWETRNLIREVGAICDFVRGEVNNRSYAKFLVQYEKDGNKALLFGKSTGVLTGRKRTSKARVHTASDLLALIGSVEGQSGFSQPLARSLMLVQAAFLAARDFPEYKATNPTKAERLKQALAFLADTAQAMVMTTFLCARMRQLVDDRKAWRRHWTALPNRREPGGKCSIDVLEGSTGRKPEKTELASHARASRHRTLMRTIDDGQTGPDPQPCEWVREGDAPDADWQRFTPDRAPQTDRFFCGAPARVFPFLRAALQPLNETDAGRRVVFLLGARGVGRGQVFSALRDEVHFAQLCEWLGRANPPAKDPLDPAACRQATSHIHSAFFNLGLSHEVISVFDRLSYLLERAVELGLARARKNDELDKFKRDCASLHTQRIVRLRHALAALAEHRVDCQPVVIVADHFSTLFNRDGRAKNAQARQIFEALTDPAYDKAKIDFLLMMNEAFLPLQVRRARVDTSGESSGPASTDDARREQYRSFWLYPDGTSPERRSQLSAQLDRIGIAYSTTPARKPQRSGRFARFAPRTQQSAEQTATQGFFVHLLEPIDPMILALRFFPRAAVAVAALALRDDVAAPPVLTLRDDGAAPPVLAYMAQASATPLDPKPDWYVPLAIGNSTNKMCPLFFQKTLTDAFKSQTATNPEIFGQTYTPEEVVELYRPEGLRRALSNLLTDSLLDPNGAWGPSDNADYFKDRLQTALNAQAKEPDKREVPRMFDRIARICGQNRYAITVLCAAVDDMISRRLAKEPRDLVNLRPVRSLIDRIELAVSGVPPTERSDTVIDHILGLYQTDSLDSLGQSLPVWPGALDWRDLVGCPAGAEENWLNGNYESEWQWVSDHAAAFAEQVRLLDKVPHNLLYQAQEEVLVAMSLIGQPVDVSVLLGVGKICSALDAIAAAIGGQPNDRDAMLRLLILCVTDLLVHRCLVFRIAAKGDEGVRRGRQYHRFATHKTVRRHVYHQFNAPVVDFAEIDQITVSLYATQPNDVPKPTAEGHRRIRYLVEQLSGYEQRFDAPPLPFSDPAATFPEKNVAGKNKDSELAMIRSARLRAAYGALRSVYSVSVISRFDTYEDQGMAPPEPGYFEAHRLRVRWLLRKASGIDGTKGELPSPGHIPTFHAEELVWLFNECGVLSLASGRLDDAAVLLLQAQQVAAHLIEGGGTGPLHSRIGLNRALVMLESGHTREADVLLDQIANDPGETDPIRLVANGYRGMTKALLGDSLGACKRFGDAAQELTRIGRYRSAAIFRTHLAETIGYADPRDPAAMREIERARELAANGGHEDIRQLALLAGARLEISARGEAMSALDKKLIVRKLDDAEDYARKMGMPRLSGRAHAARAQLLIQSGEYRLGAEAAQRALQIATRHGIDILKVTALALLGQALMMQRQPGARRLLLRARDIAQNSDYNLMVNQIEAMFIPMPS